MKKLIVGLTLGSLVFFGIHYILKSGAEEQWERDSKLYIQGYLDGKYEVLDSIKSVKK
mgnify:CR=1 FL=1